jgi:hypothetical protein
VAHPSFFISAIADTPLRVSGEARPWVGNPSAIVSFYLLLMLVLLNLFADEFWISDISTGDLLGLPLGAP